MNKKIYVAKCTNEDCKLHRVPVEIYPQGTIQNMKMYPALIMCECGKRAVAQFEDVK